MRKVLKQTITGVRLEAFDDLNVDFPNEAAANKFLKRLDSVFGAELSDNDLFSDPERVVSDRLRSLGKLAKEAYHQRDRGDLSLEALVKLSSEVPPKAKNAGSADDYIAEMEAEEARRHMSPSQRRRYIAEHNRPVETPDSEAINEAKKAVLLETYNVEGTESNLLRARMMLKHAEAGNLDRVKALGSELIEVKKAAQTQARAVFEEQIAEQRAALDAAQRRFNEAHGIEDTTPTPVSTGPKVISKEEFIERFLRQPSEPTQ